MEGSSRDDDWYPQLELRLGPPGEDLYMENRNRVNNFSSAENQWGGSKVSFSQAPGTSQRRNAPAPVVGWPPIRSFRKNIAASTSSSKPAAPEASPNAYLSKALIEKPVENRKKGLFVKINMDGVPIGRKVDLKAHDSYEKLSVAIDELFRGLLAAQLDSSEEPITGVLDGSGEFTLVYEDHEGDRMLAGDVPWHMFVSTVKRLRVLKSSELSSLTVGGKKKITLDSA